MLASSASSKALSTGERRAPVVEVILAEQEDPMVTRRLNTNPEIAALWEGITTRQRRSLWPDDAEILEMSDDELKELGRFLTDFKSGKADDDIVRLMLEDGTTDPRKEKDITP